MIVEIDKEIFNNYKVYIEINGEKMELQELLEDLKEQTKSILKIEKIHFTKNGIKYSGTIGG